MKHLIPDSFFSCLVFHLIYRSSPIYTYLPAPPLPEESPCVGLLQIGITRELAGNRKAEKKPSSDSLNLVNGKELYCKPSKRYRMFFFCSGAGFVI